LTATRERTSDRMDNLYSCCAMLCPMDGEE
jgi:hypothetical protein